MVSFTAQGVAMNCADNAAAISLSPDGTIEVTAMTDVSISSEELISLQAEENLSLTALGNVQIINAAGSDITVSETINVHGNRIMAEEKFALAFTPAPLKILRLRPYSPIWNLQSVYGKPTMDSNPTKNQIKKVATNFRLTTS